MKIVNDFTNTEKVICWGCGFAVTKLEAIQDDWTIIGGKVNCYYCASNPEKPLVIDLKPACSPERPEHVVFI